MKKILVLILSLLISLSVLAGCATVTTSTSSGSSSSASSSSGSSSQDSSSGVSDSAYTVTLLLPDGVTTMPDLDGIQAKWTNSTSVYTAPFDSTGFASCDGLDGEYTVTISGLIDGYSYNPNIYDTSSGKDVQIQLYALQTFYGNDGSSVGDEGRARAYDTGVYRIEYSSANQTFYFMFTPNQTTTGYTYSIQTYADTTENEICPTFYLYFYSSRGLKSTITGGSEYNGTYTKNIYYELDLSKYTSSSSYNPYIYALSIKSTNSSYPKYLDIVITREREYEDSYSAYPNEELDESQVTSYTAPEGTLTWISSLYTDFSNAETKKGSDGYYYLVYNDKEYMIFVELNSCHLKSVYGRAMYSAFSSGGTATLCDLGDGTCVLYNDVVTAYMQNSKDNGTYGYHPVTEQLCEFLYRYSARKIFNDGSGLMEGIGYSSNDANQWLFACGVYM